jgi:hypothetical protein
MAERIRKRASVRPPGCVPYPGKVSLKYYSAPNTSRREGGYLCPAYIFDFFKIDKQMTSAKRLSKVWHSVFDVFHRDVVANGRRGYYGAHVFFVFIGGDELMTTFFERLTARVKLPEIAVIVVDSEEVCTLFPSQKCAHPWVQLCCILVVLGYES